MFSVLRCERRFVAFAAPVLLFQGWSGAIASAEELRVAFDASYTVACRDVTPPEFGGSQARNLFEGPAEDVDVAITGGHHEALPVFGAETVGQEGVV